MGRLSDNPINAKIRMGDIEMRSPIPAKPGFRKVLPQTGIGLLERLSPRSAERRTARVRANIIRFLRMEESGWPGSVRRQKRGP